MPGSNELTPARLTAEATVITAILRGEVNPDDFDREDFLYPFHSSVYQMISEIQESTGETPVNPDNLSEYITTRALAHIAKMMLEADIDIKGAIKEVKGGVKAREVDLIHKLRSFIAVANGRFTVAEASQAITNRLDRRIPSQASQIVAIRDNIRKALWRMAQEGTEIRKAGSRDGTYERIETEMEAIDFLHAKGETVDILWPLGIEKLVSLFPKSLVVVAGLQNSGKTAFCLDAVNLNMDRWKVSYFTSEMSDSELQDRLLLFPRSLTSWKFNAFERVASFDEVIDPNGLNIIDYLELTKDFYLVAEVLQQIHRKLETGVAVVALQKKPEVDYGFGGELSKGRPRLYLTLEGHKCKIVKAKKWVDRLNNPNNQEREFKLVNGYEFRATSDWQQAQEKKWGK